MAIPFELTLKTGFAFDVKEYKNIKFYDTIEALNRPDFETEIEIKENNDVLLNIISDYDVKVEMDGLDGTLSEIIKHEDGYYISKRNQDIKIFSYDNFPLPPGYYVLSVEVNKEKYYTSFKVLPLHINEKDWQYMADVVLQQLKILAVEVVRKKFFISRYNFNKEINFELWLKMQIINASFNKVMAALDDLASKPHNKISKKYVKFFCEDVIQEDRKSNKLNNKNKNPFIYQIGLKKYLDYDLSENRYVKKIVLELDDLISEFLRQVSEEYKFLDDSIKKNNYDNDRNKTDNQRKKEALNLLLEFRAKGKKINYIINNLKSVEWFKNLDVNSNDRISAQSLLDPRYNILSKLNKDLKKNELKYNIDSKLSLLYKRTDKLYEMYGFLKIFDALVELGYDVEKTLKVEKNGNNIKVFGVEEGDCFILNKDNLKIKLIYDGIVTNSSKETNKENPIYTTSRHNRPDCRLDFFFILDNEMYYASSLVIDFKYRKINSFWNGKTNSKEQLEGYRYKIYSQYFLDYPPLASKRVKVTKEVWALYPDKNSIGKVFGKIDDSIKFLSFVPKYEDFIKKHLSNFIEGLKLSEYAELKQRLKL